MAHGFRTAYKELLSETLPTVIRTEAENESGWSEIDQPTDE